MFMDDTELIKLAQNGDADAFEQLVFRHDKKVLTMAAQYVASSDDAKDIYQEVFLNVFRNLKRFRFQSEFSTWLHRITVNVCLTHVARGRRGVRQTVRSERGEEDGNEEPAGRDEILPDRHAEGAELRSRIQEAMMGLSPKQTMVVSLRFQEGYKIHEIASMMGCTTGTVKRYLFVATRKLRNQLKYLNE